LDLIWPGWVQFAAKTWPNWRDIEVFERSASDLARRGAGVGAAEALFAVTLRIDTRRLHRHLRALAALLRPLR